MIGISRNMEQRNGVETIIDSHGILRLNKKQKEEGLNHKNLRVTAVKYLLDHRKHTYELVDEPKNNPLLTKVMMD